MKTKHKNWTWEGLKFSYGVYWNGMDYYMMGTSLEMPYEKIFKIIFFPIKFIFWIFEGDY